MSINANHWRLKIVRPTLQQIDLYSPSAEELLMLTWAQETHGATYLQQGYKTLDDGRGVGLGPYSMEPATHGDIWTNYLHHRPRLAALVRSQALSRGVPVPPASEMIGNHYYATAMARVHYLRAAAPLPGAADLNGLAIYWDEYYNRNPNAGFPDEAVRNYRRYALD